MTHQPQPQTQQLYKVTLSNQKSNQNSTISFVQYAATPYEAIRSVLTTLLLSGLSTVHLQVKTVGELTKM